MVENTILPLVSHAVELVQEYKEGKTPPISEFLDNEMVEVTPKLIHGMSLVERERQIQDIIYQLNEFCKNDEVKNSNLILSVESDLEYLKSILNKEWVPIPTLKKSSLKFSNYEINEDISVKDLVVSFPAIITKEKGVKIKYDLFIDDKSISDSTVWVSPFYFFFTFGAER